jgi:hypothetical protein
MIKDIKLEVRITRAEKRALVRFAKSDHRTVAELVRERVIRPAVLFDPRQAALPLGEKEHRERRTG